MIVKIVLGESLKSLIGELKLSYKRIRTFSAENWITLLCVRKYYLGMND